MRKVRTGGSGSSTAQRGSVRRPGAGRALQLVPHAGPRQRLGLHKALSGDDGAPAQGYRREEPVGGDLHAARAEVLARERAHDAVRRLGGSRAGTPAPTSRGGTIGPCRTPVAAERDAQDRAGGKRPAEREDFVAGEVAQGVGDQPTPVPLHPAQHVRAVPDDEVGAGVDRRAEPDDVATVLPEERLRAALHVLAVATLGPCVHRRDDDVGASRGGATSRRAAAMSVSDAAHGYDAKPTTATRMSPTCCTVTCPAGPCAGGRRRRARRSSDPGRAHRSRTRGCSRGSPS